MRPRQTSSGDTDPLASSAVYLAIHSVENDKFSIDQCYFNCAS